MNKRRILLFVLIFFILAAIPLTIFLARQQQDIRQQASGSTTLFFTPQTTQTSPLQQAPNTVFPLDMMVDPGTNAVSLVRFEITYDPTKLTPDTTTPFSVNTTAFPTVLEGPFYSTGKISGTVSIGSNNNNAIRTTTKVATFRFKATGVTGTTPTLISFTSNAQVLSVGSGDQAAENVLSSTQPAYVTIVAPTPTPTACAVPIASGIGKITGNTPDKCEKITWSWSPATNANEYIITLNNVEKYRGPGTPCSFDSTKLCHTLTNVAPGTYTDCLQSGNSCGLSTPSCGTTNVGACPVATATPTPTSIPVPTNTPIPTNTPVPQATKFNLIVFMHGIGNSGDNANPTAHSLSNKNPIHQQRNVTVEVLNSGGTTVLTKSGLVNYNSINGNFTGTIDMGTTLASGVYIVKVKSHQYLRRQIPGIQTVTAQQTHSLPAITFVTGDINDDNLLNILDYNIIIGCYSDFAPAVSCNNTLKVDSDLTDDGNVNQFDYNLFLRDLSVQNGD